eukprot:2996497-Prymnesium_polylepis.1
MEADCLSDWLVVACGMLIARVRSDEAVDALWGARAAVGGWKLDAYGARTPAPQMSGRRRGRDG